MIRVLAKNFEQAHQIMDAFLNSPNLKRLVINVNEQSYVVVCGNLALLL